MIGRTNRAAVNPFWLSIQQVLKVMSFRWRRTKQNRLCHQILARSIQRHWVIKCTAFFLNVMYSSDHLSFGRLLRPSANIKRHTNIRISLEFQVTRVNECYQVEAKTAFRIQHPCGDAFRWDIWDCHFNDIKVSKSAWAKVRKTVYDHFPYL